MFGEAYLAFEGTPFEEAFNGIGMAFPVVMLTLLFLVLVIVPIIKRILSRD